jgi:hypothetical protein
MIGRMTVQTVGMLVGLGALTAPVSAQAELLGRAGWLSGCWESRAGERVTNEMWLPPAGDLMVGAGRTTVGPSARAFEHLRLRAVEGSLVYTAIPSGQRETDFTSTTVSDTLLVFENLQHDFPQRIIYRRVGADEIAARIEGPGPDGATRGFDIPLRRVSCTVSPPPARP